MTEVKSQEKIRLHILEDYSSTGRLLNWSEKKVKNELLSIAYQAVSRPKAERLRECASFLQYSVQKDTGKKKLKTANFCRVRLCPICTWRRSLKIFSQVTKIMDELKKDKEYGYVFLTLTVKNICSDELRTTIDDMMEAWRRLIGYKKFEGAVKGWIRTLEITHNVNPLSTSYDTFHPHFHVILCVNKSYFKNKTYITQAEFTEYWKKAAGLNYDPIVDVRRIKGNTAKAVAEVSKYAVKDKDFIVPDDWDLTVDTVRILDKTLHKRRLVAFGGLIKKMHKKLQLDDIEDGDLVHVDGETPADDDGRLITFEWCSGYRQYIGVD
jgi:plasmid rolling circle replication initiator protein Rep